MEQLISDEVWNRLDPRAGALSRKQRVRAGIAAAASAAVLCAGFALDRSGAVRAHLAVVGSGYHAAVSVNPSVLIQEVFVRNPGWTTLRIVGVGQDGPGLELLDPDEPDARHSGITGMTGIRPPFDLPAGQTATMVVAYRVTGCAAVPAGPFPVPVRVDRFWGTQTIDISLPQTYVGPNGTAINPSMTEWQKALADQACRARP